MAFSTRLLPSIFGILDNIISFHMFIVPLPTFIRIYKKKSTPQGFQSVPYSVALFSCMLLLYYGYLKTENGMMIITINSIGCAIETTYIVLFLIYSTKEILISTTKLLAFFNELSFGLIIITTLLATDDGPKRVTIVGWNSTIFSVCVYVDPISIMRLVKKTESTEYMSFSLSLFLTLCAVIRFVYGLLIKDYYVVTTNVIGFVIGIAQMILYLIYKDKGELAKTMVDLEANLEMQENAGVGVGVGLVGDEAGGDKKEDIVDKSIILYRPTLEVGN